MTENIKDENIPSEEITMEQITKEEKKEFALPKISIKKLLENGVHLGHQTSRWNAKMAPYIYTIRNGGHIIDLDQTKVLLEDAVKILYEISKKRGKILFVCTKKQGSKSAKEFALKCKQFYVNNKWLGGMLTNWKTVSRSLKTLRMLEERLDSKDEQMTKKERLNITREKDKLAITLDGIRSIGGSPDLLFVVDTNKESLAIKEAKKLNIPVMAITDTNSNPEDVNYPIPGNDDSMAANRLYFEIVSEAILAGLADAPEEKKKTSGKKEFENSKKASKSGFGDKSKKAKTVSKTDGDKKTEVKKESPAKKTEEKSEKETNKNEAKVDASNNETEGK